jgi:hypothetical protein
MDKSTFDKKLQGHDLGGRDLKCKVATLAVVTSNPVKWIVGVPASVQG